MGRRRLNNNNNNNSNKELVLLRLSFYCMNMSLSAPTAKLWKVLHRDLLKGYNTAIGIPILEAGGKRVRSWKSLVFVDD